MDLLPPAISLRSVLEPSACLYPDSAPPSSRKIQDWMKNRSPHSSPRWASTQSTSLSKGCCVQSTGESWWLQRSEGNRQDVAKPAQVARSIYFEGQCELRGKAYLSHTMGKCHWTGCAQSVGHNPLLLSPHPISAILNIKCVKHYTNIIMMLWKSTAYILELTV